MIDVCSNQIYNEDKEEEEDVKVEETIIGPVITQHRGSAPPGSAPPGSADPGSVPPGSAPAQYIPTPSGNRRTSSSPPIRTTYHSHQTRHPNQNPYVQRIDIGASTTDVNNNTISTPPTTLITHSIHTPNPVSTAHNTANAPSTQPSTTTTAITTTSVGSARLNRVDTDEDVTGMNSPSPENIPIARTDTDNDINTMNDPSQLSTSIVMNNADNGNVNIVDDGDDENMYFVD